MVLTNFSQVRSENPYHHVHDAAGDHVVGHFRNVPPGDETHIAIICMMTPAPAHHFRATIYSKVFDAGSTPVFDEKICQCAVTAAQIDQRKRRIGRAKPQKLGKAQRLRRFAAQSTPRGVAP